MAHAKRASAPTRPPARRMLLSMQPLPNSKTGLAHAIDSVALLGYFAAIGLGATLLDIPYPWVLAGAISLACLVATSASRIGARAKSTPPLP